MNNMFSKSKYVLSVGVNTQKYFVLVVFKTSKNSFQINQVRKN